MTCCLQDTVEDRIARLTGFISGRSRPDYLARHTGEHCAVVRFGDKVVKFLKPAANAGHEAQVASQWAARVTVANAHPDLFTAIEFDRAGWYVVQDYRVGRHATPEERTNVVYETLRKRRLMYVVDVVPSNIIVTAGHEWSIVDFHVNRELRDRLKAQPRQSARR